MENRVKITIDEVDFYVPKAELLRLLTYEAKDVRISVSGRIVDMNQRTTTATESPMAAATAAQPVEATAKPADVARPVDAARSVDVAEPRGNLNLLAVAATAKRLSKLALHFADNYEQFAAFFIHARVALNLKGHVDRNGRDAVTMNTYTIHKKIPPPTHVASASIVGIVEELEYIVHEVEKICYRSTIPRAYLMARDMPVVLVLDNAFELYTEFNKDSIDLPLYLDSYYLYTQNTDLLGAWHKRIKEYDAKRDKMPDERHNWAQYPLFAIQDLVARGRTCRGRPDGAYLCARVFMEKMLGNTRVIDFTAGNTQMTFNMQRMLSGKYHGVPDKNRYHTINYPTMRTVAAVEVINLEDLVIDD